MATRKTAPKTVAPKLYLLNVVVVPTYALVTDEGVEAIGGQQMQIEGTKWDDFATTAFSERARAGMLASLLEHRASGVDQA